MSCTADRDGKLPPITWRQIPFRQENIRLTGLYSFTDHFKHQNSVMFSGTLSGQNGRVDVTAVRRDGAPNFTVELTGSQVLMNRANDVRYVATAGPFLYARSKCYLISNLGAAR